RRTLPSRWSTPDPIACHIRGVGHTRSAVTRLPPRRETCEHMLHPCRARAPHSHALPSLQQCHRGYDNHAMSFYERFASRSRNRIGLWTKRFQARTIFRLGTAESDGRQLAVLELGPGDGYIAELCQAAGHDYLAVDGSAAVVRNLTERGVRVVQAVVAPLPGETPPLEAFLIAHAPETPPGSTTTSPLCGEDCEP